MKRNLFILAFVLGLFILTADVFAENLSLLNTSNDSTIERRLTRAVPGVDGRVVGQDTPSAAITTEPPTTTPAATTLPPEPVEKAACGPTALLALAILPLLLKRKNQ